MGHTRSQEESGGANRNRSILIFESVPALPGSSWLLLALLMIHEDSWAPQDGPDSLWSPLDPGSEYMSCCTWLGIGSKPPTTRRDTTNPASYTPSGAKARHRT